MSARTKDERINEKAKEIYELLKEWATTHVCPNHNTGKCDCRTCRSDRLTKWVEEGRQDDKCDLCGSDLDQAGEYCMNRKCKNSPFTTPGSLA